MCTISASEIQVHPKNSSRSNFKGQDQMPKHEVQKSMHVFSMLLKLDKYEVQIKDPRMQVEPMIRDQVGPSSTIITSRLHWSCDTDAGSLLALG